MLDRVLNTPKFWICLKYRLYHCSAYARFLSVPQVLNIPGFWMYKLAKMFFRFVSRFHKVCGDLSVFRTFFTHEILFLVIKFVLNRISLTWNSTKLNIVIFCCVFWIDRLGYLFYCNTDILPCSVMPSA